ncbi:Low-affinity inorganic phosphate transporter 1 [bacterium HR10]|nr:Low-affinity inorganic phosphate transporter 1 [bacterium HR10]
MTIVLLILAVGWLAYSNGANDNFKGVATLYGSATVGYRPALWWATLATVAGGMVSGVAAQRLFVVFSGDGLVPPSLVGTPELLITVGLASAITIFLATELGLPTSTTHALMGALLGAALVSSSGRIGWSLIADRFVASLMLSPVVALAMTAMLYAVLRRLRLAAGITRQTCVCVGSQAPHLVHVRLDGTAVLAASGLSISVGQTDNCLERYHGRVLGVDAQTIVDAVHYLSAGAVCFGRAMNDTPKIVALLVAAPTVNSSWGLAVVVMAMVLGGLLNARGVAETMSKRITDLNSGQGLTANLVTAVLVLLASPFGLPVSTTHVSCGAIFGIGLVNRAFQWKTVARILAAWVTTFPLAAAIGGVLFWLVR